MLPQLHRPGEALQTDFTNCNSLAVTIGGESFDHLLCHTVLPYSNWQWVTVARSESLLALERGIQEAVFRMGRTPSFSQTDNSTAATHDLRTGKRGFNEEYLSLCERLSMKPRTIAIGESHQNGDVEALNGALKRRIKQHLLLRGSRDFASVEEYEGWLWSILERANALRVRDFEQELAQMRPVTACTSSRATRSASAGDDKRDHQNPEQHLLGTASTLGVMGHGAAERSVGRGVFWHQPSGSFRAPTWRRASPDRLSPRDLVDGAQARGIRPLSFS